MNNMINSVYIHIPFCKKICSYCDFSKIFYNKQIIDKYLYSLEQEIDKTYQKDIIKTLYIGGGTPSSLDQNELLKLMQIIKKLNLDKTCEFTFEVNINDISKTLLTILKENKVNRLSIGIETINPRLLKIMERSHNKKQVKEKLKLARKYFSNISVDLMYALPTETIKELKKDLNFITSLKVKHISFYSLILEENTKLYINNYKQLDEQLETKMYKMILSHLKKHNYIHYEISNASIKGYESKHNLNYWLNGTYYGFGLSSSSFINNKRCTNTRNINKYLEGNYKLYEEKMDKKTNMENELMLSLRLIKGINTITFYNKYNQKIENTFKIDDLLKKGYLKRKNNYLFIPKKYLYIQNQILTRFIDT